MMTERKIFNQYNSWFFLLKNTVLAHKGTSFAGAHRFIFLLCFERFLWVTGFIYAQQIIPVEL